MKRALKILQRKKFKPAGSVVFIACCIIFLAHQITQRVLQLSIPFADNYLDNFLATPILLTLLLIERRAFFGYGENYILSVPEVCWVTVFIAVVGEVLFPQLSQDFTADWLDVPIYVLGSLLFYVTINKN